MNKLKVFIIISVVIILIIIFFIVSFFNRRQNPTTNIPTNPTPTILLNSSELFISSILPSDTNIAYLPAQPIQITFTQEVEKTGLKLQIDPPTEVLINPGETPNTLVISPLASWIIGQTTISILSNTISTSGNQLKNPHSYILKTAIPTIPDSLEGNY